MIDSCHLVLIVVWLSVCEMKDLLIKYKILNPMEEREYVKKQAAHVGLALPQFQDMKEDSKEYTVKTSPPMSSYESAAGSERK